MPKSPNNLSNLWQELKRRNVTRVLAVYIAAAFMLLELISMFSEQIGLPDGTWKVAFFISLAGLVIAVIISWIYDIHPEEGMVKTEPTTDVPEEITRPSFKGWKIASYISFVVIVSLIILNIIPRTGKKEILDKSIAVLPFRNDSPDEKKMYFINGTMEAILDNLCKIKDLRVVSRTSTEQYRNVNKAIPVIAREMNVGYILEGSGQKTGNRLLLTVQLIDGISDHHVWSRQYDREIRKVEDLIEIQSEIAQLVSGEIKSIITPEEKELIEKIPTTNITAYDFFQRAEEEMNNKNYNRAEELFYKALSNDSTFADAYVGLADIFFIRNQHMSDYYSEDYMDSVLILTNIALTYNDQSSAALSMRSIYYLETGKTDLAFNDLDEVIKLNPNNASAYLVKGFLYQNSNPLECISAFNKAVNIDRGPGLNFRLRYLAMAYLSAGYIDKSIHHYQEALKLDDDSVYYYSVMGRIEYDQGNFHISIDYYQKALEIDPTHIRNRLAQSLYHIGKYKESLEYFKLLISQLEENFFYARGYTHRIAYAYWQNGLKEEAEHYFDLQIEHCLGEINSDRSWAEKYFAYYNLAGVYAFRGEKEMAFENLRIFNQIQNVPYWLGTSINRDELFESIRDEPEFQQIVRDVEAKYQVEHERVRQWLEENDML